MIVLPEEDDERVDSQVYRMIGAALRESVANAEPSPLFRRRLAAALDQAAQADGEVVASAS